MTDRLRPCLWIKGNVQEAASFYADNFPDSQIERVVNSPAPWPNGDTGDPITVDMILVGQPVMLLSGGPDDDKPNKAISLSVETADQAETDRLWNAIVDHGGQPIQCGWCRDRYGFNWQVTPRLLNELIASDDKQVAERAFEAMVEMVKIDVATLEKVVADQAGDAG